MAEEDWIWGMSSKFGGQMSRAGISDNYICVGKNAGTYNHLLLYEVENLSRVADRNLYDSSNSTIGIVIDNNYVYIAKDTINRIERYTLPNLTYSTYVSGDITSVVYSGAHMIIHNSKLYAIDSSRRRIRVHNLPNLSFVALSDYVSAATQLSLRSLAIHDNYIYAGLGGYISGTGYIYELHLCRLSDLEWIDSISLYAQNASPNKIIIYDDYIYISQGTKIYRYNLLDLSYIDESDEYVSTINRFAIHGDYLYAGGSKNPIYCYSLSDLSYVDESPSLIDSSLVNISVHHGYVHATTDFHILRWPLYKTPSIYCTFTAPTLRNVVKDYTYTAPTKRNLIKKYTFTAPTLRRLLAPLQTFTAPTVRRLVKEYSYEAPTVRRVIKEYKYRAGTVRRLIKEQKYVAPTLRRLTKAYTYSVNTLRQVIKKYNYIAPTLRQLIAKQKYVAKTSRRLVKEYNYKVPTMRQLIKKYKYVAATLRWLFVHDIDVPLDKFYIEPTSLDFSLKEVN